MSELPLSPTLAAPVGAGSSLTENEQRLYSLVVAAEQEASDTSVSGVLSTCVGEHSQRRKSLLTALQALGVCADCLADGTLVVSVSQAASATDQVILASRVALLVKERWPEAEVAVATGRGTSQATAIVGEVADRAAGLLTRRTDQGTAVSQREPTAGVWLDELSARLLGPGFILACIHDGVLLVGEDREVDLSRRLLGKPTACVGREAELAALEGQLECCLEESEARVVVVTAPPGVGKSRLRHEFLRRLKQRGIEPVLVNGQADLMSAGAPYGILCDALRRLCGLRGGEHGLDQRARLRTRFEQRIRSSERERIVEFLGELCNIPLPDEESQALRAARQDPKLMQSQLRQAFTEWLQAECAVAPVLLVLDDLHWGDALSIALLDHVLRVLEGERLFILALARPEIYETFPKLWQGHQLHEIGLKGLGRKASERLIVQILGKEVPIEIVSRLIEQAEGNALYLEELIRAVAEGKSEDQPDTVLAMLQARIGRLSAGARLALRAASIYGQTFWSAGISVLIECNRDAPELVRWLHELIDAEIIKEGPDSHLTNEKEYRFRHALVREAAYGLLTDEARVNAHRSAGAYLEKIGSIEPAILAEHARKGLEPERAARFFVDAAKQAISRYDPDATQRYAQQAFDCGLSDEQRAVVRAMQARVFFRVDLERGYIYALEAVEILPTGSYWWAKAIGICFYSFFLINRYEKIEQLTQSFMQATPEPDARVASLEAGYTLSLFFTNVGNRKAAGDTILKLKQIASTLEYKDHGLLYLADAWRTTKLELNLFKAIKDAQIAVELFRNNADRLYQSIAMFYLGVAYTAIGSFAAGEQVLRHGMEISIDINEPFRAAIIHLHLGFNLTYQTDPIKQSEANNIGAVYSEKREMGPAIQGLSYRLLGKMKMMAGDIAGAIISLQMARKAFAKMLSYRLEVDPILIEALLRQGRVTEARQLAEDDFRFLKEQGGFGASEVPVRLALILARFADDNYEEAQSALIDTLEQLQLRTEMIENSELRQAFTNTPENQHLLELTRTHGVAIGYNSSL